MSSEWSSRIQRSSLHSKATCPESKFRQYTYGSGATAGLLTAGEVMSRLLRDGDDIFSMIAVGLAVREARAGGALIVSREFLGDEMFRVG
jgi:hypothetical protein